MGLEDDYKQYLQDHPDDDLRQEYRQHLNEAQLTNPSPSPHAESLVSADSPASRIGKMAKGTADDNYIWDIVAGLAGGTKALSSALGGAAIEGTHQLYQHLTHHPDAPQTTTEAAKRMGEQALIGAGGAKLGEYGTKAGQYVIKKLAERPGVPAAEEAVAFTKEGMPYQGQPMARPNELPLTVAQQTEGHIATTLQNATENAIFGGAKMGVFHQSAHDYMKAGMEDFARHVGGRLTPEELGVVIGKALQGERTVTLAPLRAAYNQLDGTLEAKSVRRMVLVRNKNGEMVPVPTMVLDPKSGAVINMKSIKAEAKKFLDPTHHTVSGQTSTILQKILDTPDEISYIAAKELKTTLDEMGYQSFLATNKKDQAVGMARKFAGMVRKTRLAAVDRYDKRAGEQLRALDQKWGEAANRVDTDYLRGLIDTALDKSKRLPETIKKDIITPHGISQLRRVKASIGHTETWSKLQSAALYGEMELSKDPVTKNINFKTLEKRLFGRDIESYESGLGHDVVSTLFSPEQLSWIKKALNVGLQQQKQPVNKVGTMAIQMKQAGAVALVGAAAVGAVQGEYATPKEAAGYGVGASTVVLVGPELVARFITTPRLAKYFIKGLTTPSKDPAAGPILTKLAAEVAFYYHQQHQSLPVQQPPRLTNRSLPPHPQQQGFPAP